MLKLPSIGLANYSVLESRQRIGRMRCAPLPGARSRSRDRGQGYGDGSHCSVPRAGEERTIFRLCLRTAMERRLKRAGYEVAVYASAQPLLDRLPSESVPSCILLDVRIPELSGPELQERLSKLGSSRPIIFVSGHPDIPTTVQAIKAGADDFLTNPVPLDELLEAVERAIAHHE